MPPSRRTFLTAAASSMASLAGCNGCRPRDPAASVTSSVDMKRIEAERAERVELLAALTNSPAPADLRFTTPPRQVNLLDLFPEVRPLQRQALRLHPCYADEPPPEASKLGGRFLWPADEPWPVDESLKVPFVPVLQLRAEDAPTQVKFKPGSDLLQLLWLPRDRTPNGGPTPLVVWRRAADVTGNLADPPDTRFAFTGYVPVPCRLFPERVMELPDWHTLRVTPLREKVEAWTPDGGRNPAQFYEKELSAAPGTKVGGYQRWLGTPNPQTCPTCKRGMDYLLTIDADERFGETAWKASAVSKSGFTPQADDCGLKLPDPGNVHVYVCRRCEDWPTAVAR